MTIFETRFKLRERKKLYEIMSENDDSKWQINSYRAIGLAGKPHECSNCLNVWWRVAFESKPHRSKSLEPSSSPSSKQIRIARSALLVSLPVVGLQTKRDEPECAIYIRVIHTFGKWIGKCYTNYLSKWDIMGRQDVTECCGGVDCACKVCCKFKHSINSILTDLTYYTIILTFYLVLRCKKQFPNSV